MNLPQRELPSPTGGDCAAADLLEANGLLLHAGLKPQQQADLEIRLRAEAEAALAMRDRFIAIAAHELRTPVTAIKASAQLALRGLTDTTPEGERFARYQLHILEGANRLVLLINDLMDVSQMRSGRLQLHMASVDLGALVRTVGLRYAQTAGDRHEVTTNLPAEPLVVRGDAGRLEQVLDNLLSNAVKYSPAGGIVGLTLGQDGDGVLLTVKDPGIGLTPGAQELVFEPFGRAANATRQALPGMGLGLHICRQIVEAHGGRIWADSVGEGHGMTVGLWLPQASVLADAFSV